nr:hypothetical protein [Nanoarchaeum sp.]
MAIDYIPNEESEELYHKYSTKTTPYLCHMAAGLEDTELDAQQQLHFDTIKNILDKRKIKLISRLLDEPTDIPTLRSIKVNHLLWRLYSRTGADQDLVNTYFDKTLDTYDELSQTCSIDESNYLEQLISDMGLEEFDEENPSELTKTLISYLRENADIIRQGLANRSYPMVQSKQDNTLFFYLKPIQTGFKKK